MGFQSHQQGTGKVSLREWPLGESIYSPTTGAYASFQPSEATHERGAAITFEAAKRALSPQATRL